MFDAMSPKTGARYEGRVTVAEAGLSGMITLRGALDTIAQPVADATGLEVPDTLGIVEEGGRALAWMSPDEMMLFCAYEDAADLAARLAEATADEHALVVDMSDARAIFVLTGAETSLRETLAKLTPADVRPEAFPAGMVRRSRLAQAAAAFWIANDGTLRVMCFRSVADYVFALLSHAAHPEGAVDHF
ncbi:Sarcosine oxidase, gamma subunit family [Roseivivax jejudonensis]|uniref:Sarcosine oxidase, gamma subunit family n=1 Tax=Roseivivax jejudonensis TaxID=1529041 RepID=A0A1X6YN89_9RHOB|nr:sarcosine oxidase subunit gamma family protein [Roseivivax jejudonensis]SLN26469.1 Sarcosine oxidase, gamma subunit family [Roseivivax jejudonensis]